MYDLGGVYTTMLWAKNRDISCHFICSFTRKRWKRTCKTETSESGDLHVTGDIENGAQENASVNIKNAGSSKYMYDGNGQLIVMWLWEGLALVKMAPGA